MPKQALLFLKPGAKEQCQEALESLADAGIECHEPNIDDADEISAAIEANANNADLVIVGGGDGSLSAAARGLRKTGLPLGILPLGTANDFARSLSIPFNALEAAKIIAAGHQHVVDLGSVNDRLFFNAAQIGLAEEVTGEMDSTEKKRWGALSYLFGSIRALRKNTPMQAHITDAEGNTHQLKALQISVGNGRNFGGGMVINDDAKLDDGRLDLVCLKRRELSPLELSRLFMIAVAMRSGHQNLFERVLSLEGNEFTVKTDSPRAITADGEPIAETPAVFRVHPAKVKVLVPVEHNAAALQDE